MAIYTIRSIPDSLWKRIKVRAAQEGHTLRFIIIKLLTGYAEGR